MKLPGRFLTKLTSRFVSPGLPYGQCVALFVLAIMLGYAGAANAGPWHVGDLTTYGASLWGGPPSDPGAALLAADLDTVYASVGGVILGSPSGFAMVFTDAPSVNTFLPSIAPYAPLNGSTLNPDPFVNATGAFGQDLLALKLNVDFSDAGFLPGTSGQRFGDLVLTNFSTLPQLNGLTVSQFLGDMNTLLSGGSSIVSISDLGAFNADAGNLLLPAFNNSFSGGFPSQFAQDHFVHAGPWQVGDLTTYGTSLWGGPPSDPGAALLAADLDTVYASVGGVILGSPSGFTMVFTDAPSVNTYLPSIAPYAPLNGSTLNPDLFTNATGAFGQELLALKLNVDFSDAGFLPGTSGPRFGDLVLTNFSTLPQLNGLTVRQLLGDMNTLLSGGSSGVSIGDVGTFNADVGNLLLPALNESFSGGVPSGFAEDHLVAPSSGTGNGSEPTVPEPSTVVLSSILFGTWGVARGYRQLRRTGATV